ncbi:e3 ubiquitin-protein ligase topors [Fagus crenata]
MKQEANKSIISHSSLDSNPCPICLGPILQESYLDKCFHKFCYNCIVQWTKVVAGKHSRPPSSVKCPLCKTENLSILHGYDGSSFQRHYINQDFRYSFLLTRAHKYRLQCYYTEPGIVNDIFNVSRYWKSHKYLQPNRWLQSWLRREIQALIQVCIQ